MSGLTKKLCWCGLFLPLLLSSLLVAQQNSRRLILKDGSYQSATQWEIKGDRVRFYSSERYGWEELPTTLVDWAATERYNRELENSRSSGQLTLSHTPDDTDKEDQPAKPETPPVAPGLSLPDDGGVFLLDTYKSQAQLVELDQSGGELNKHTGRNILRAAINPLALSSKQTIEIQGIHAAVQAHVTQPVLYVQLDGEETPANGAQSAPQTSAPPSAAERYRIVRLQRKKDSRVVGDLNIGITGKMSQKENWVKTASAPYGPWTRITPTEPLAQGEYAIVELLDKGQINLYVWDFGVDASAPANANAHVAPAPAGKKEPPELKKHFF
jgi:hypothetical protein